MKITQHDQQQQSKHFTAISVSYSCNKVQAPQNKITSHFDLKKERWRSIFKSGKRSLHTGKSVRKPRGPFVRGENRDSIGTASRETASQSETGRDPRNFNKRREAKGTALPRGMCVNAISSRRGPSRSNVSSLWNTPYKLHGLLLILILFTCAVRFGFNCN